MKRKPSLKCERLKRCNTDKTLVLRCVKGYTRVLPSSPGCSLWSPISESTRGAPRGKNVRCPIRCLPTLASGPQVARLTKNRSGGKRLIASFTKILFAYHPSPEIAERRFRKSFQNPKVRIENKSFAFTGRVVALKVEADGDLHIALQGATGDKPGIVVCEYPPSRSGVQFVKWFSVGRLRDSLFTLALLRS